MDDGGSGLICIHQSCSGIVACFVTRSQPWPHFEVKLRHLNRLEFEKILGTTRASSRNSKMRPSNAVRIFERKGEMRWCDTRKVPAPCLDHPLKESQQGHPPCHPPTPHPTATTTAAFRRRTSATYSAHQFRRRTGHPTSLSTPPATATSLIPTP
jgi:hypothetical protein